MDSLIQDPTFWVAVAFVVFVVLVFKPIKVALIGGIDAKIAEIRQEVEEAEKLREEAQSLLANYQRQQRQAIQDAEAIVARAKEEAERDRVEADEAMKDMVRRQEEQAREKIAQAEAAAIQEVRSMSVELAMAAAESFSQSDLPEMRARALSITQSRIYRANCNDLTRHGPLKAPVRRGFFVSCCQSVKAAIDVSCVNWVSGTTKACHTLSAPQRAAIPQYSIDRAPMQRSVRARSGTA